MDLLRQLDLSDGLLDDDRYAFDVLSELLIRLFHTRFERMTSTHLMHTLDAYFIRPAVGIVDLYLSSNLQTNEAV